MSKYDQQTHKVNLKKILMPSETIIWSGKPKKSAFVINQILTMLPVALLWLAFDGTFITLMLTQGEAVGPMLWFIIPFFALHLMPVWIWLSNILTANKKWKNTEYAVTDKRILIITGFIGMDYQTIYYKDIKKVDLKVGVIDKLLGVGDIHFDLAGRNAGVANFLDIESVYEIYPKIQQVVLDIQTDIEYPNNLRPGENDGYNTKYNSKF